MLKHEITVDIVKAKNGPKHINIKLSYWVFTKHTISIIIPVYINVNTNSSIYIYKIQLNLVLQTFLFVNNLVCKQRHLAKFWFCLQTLHWGTAQPWPSFLHEHGVAIVFRIMEWTKFESWGSTVCVRACVSHLFCYNFLRYNLWFPFHTVSQRLINSCEVLHWTLNWSCLTSFIMSHTYILLHIKNTKRMSSELLRMSKQRKFLVILFYKWNKLKTDIFSPYLPAFIIRQRETIEKYSLLGLAHCL